MKQTKIDSVLESLTNILIGFTVAILSQLLIFPIMGKEFSFGENLFLTSFFTVISFCRSYLIRRIFNNKSVYEYFRGKYEK